MKKTKETVLLLLLVLALVLTACGPAAVDNTGEPENGIEEANGDEAQGLAEEESETYIFTDSAGRQVELPKKIERVAPSGSLAQIVLFALAPDHFVGLSGRWADDSEFYLAQKYLDLPVFGQFYGSADLNMEALAAAAPQVIIDIGEKKDSIVEDMDAIQEQLGIPAIFIEATTDKMAECYTTLGKVLSLEAEAKVLADYCDEIYLGTKEKMEALGEDKKVSVLYLLGDTGTNVIAKTSYHAEVLDLLTDNLAVVDSPSSRGSGNEVSLEQVYQWDPEVILFAPGSVYDAVENDSAWAALQAIGDGRYYEVPYGPYNWMGFPPSVNRYMGMIWLAELLYPEEFDYDLYEETQRYYELFYHADLSQEKFEALVKNALPEK